MCLAIVKPKGVQIARKYLENGFYNNEDGAGFAVAVGGKLIIKKGFFKFTDFMEAFKPYANKMAIIHFRASTHGKVTEENCHPYPLLNNRYAMIHNGVISIKRTINEDMSDTYHFGELVLGKMLKEHKMDDLALKYLVETSIGSNNKVALLRRDGAYFIYNEESGSWHKGAWFSNGGYNYRKYKGTFCDTSRGRQKSEKEMQSFLGDDWYRDSQGFWKRKPEKTDTQVTVYNEKGEAVNTSTIISNLKKEAKKEVKLLRNGEDDENDMDGIPDFNPSWTYQDYLREEMEAQQELREHLAAEMQADLDSIQEQEAVQRGVVGAS
jgi:predicted glutamine amidotransferase